MNPTDAVQGVFERSGAKADVPLETNARGSWVAGPIPELPGQPINLHLQEGTSGGELSLIADAHWQGGLYQKERAPLVSSQSMKG